MFTDNTSNYWFELCRPNCKIIALLDELRSCFYLSHKAVCKLCVCMFACVYVFNVYMYVLVHMCACTWAYMCVYVCTQVCILVCVYSCVHACIHSCMFIHVCTCTIGLHAQNTFTMGSDFLQTVL